jgi:hypothetical protein
MRFTSSQRKLISYNYLNEFIILKLIIKNAFKSINDYEHTTL